MEVHLGALNINKIDSTRLDSTEMPPLIQPQVSAISKRYYDIIDACGCVSRGIVAESSRGDFVDG